MTGPVVIRGAGDIATGIAVRLVRCGYRVVLTERAEPLSVRRMVCFSEAVREGTWTVEGVTARLAPTAEAALALAAQGEAAVLVDPELRALPALRPAALVDAILAKRNTGTALADAPLVIACGPGFAAGQQLRRLPGGQPRRKRLVRVGHHHVKLRVQQRKQLPAAGRAGGQNRFFPFHLLFLPSHSRWIRLL